MEPLLSGSTGNPLLESGSIVIGALVRDVFWDDIGIIVIGALVKDIFWDDIGIITEQIDSGSYAEVGSGSILIGGVKVYFTVPI